VRFGQLRLRLEESMCLRSRVRHVLLAQHAAELFHINQVYAYLLGECSCLLCEARGCNEDALDNLSVSRNSAVKLPHNWGTNQRSRGEPFTLE
jgi:hypothetical protein